MDYDEHLAAVAREGAMLADALAAGPISAGVPTCPGWEVADLAEHVGSLTAFWAHVLCESTGRPKSEVEDLPRGSGPEAVAAWYRKLAGDLVEELRAADPGTEVWTWSRSDHHARFVARRCAHELAVHRFDAQRAHGIAAPIDPALAADGIDEIFALMDAWRELGRTDRGSFRGEGETLHLHGTDPGREDEWLVTLAADGVRVERAHAKGDLALRGSVSDLELLLYGRPVLGEVQRFGDDGVLEAWFRAFHFA